MVYVRNLGECAVRCSETSGCVDVSLSGGEPRDTETPDLKNTADMGTSCVLFEEQFGSHFLQCRNQWRSPRISAVRDCLLKCELCTSDYGFGRYSNFDPALMSS